MIVTEDKEKVMKIKRTKVDSDTYRFLAGDDVLVDVKRMHSLSSAYSCVWLVVGTVGGRVSKRTFQKVGTYLEGVDQSNSCCNREKQ